MNETVTTPEQALEALNRWSPEELRQHLAEDCFSALTDSERQELSRRMAREGRTEILRLLCERCQGLDLAPAEDGRTLLHSAALSGDSETIRFAAEVLGFSPLQGDARGITPLMLAREGGEAGLREMERLAGGTSGQFYQNPVRRGFYPDPSVIRVGEDYYLINSTFMMAPALPISHSRDLIHWKTIGHVFEDAETACVADAEDGFGYWAPDISFYHGRFWVVATLRRNTFPYRLQMITSAPAIRGPWEKPRFLPIDGIDPSLFDAGDGRRYLLVNPGLQAAEISEEGELLEQPRMLYYGWNRHKTEGPHLIRRGEWIYAIVAEGGTGRGHMISCARTRSLSEPFLPCPWNPILGVRDPRAYIMRGGHGKPVELPDGRWAILYLCGRRVEDETPMGRETALDPLTWTTDGWPMVNGLQGPSCQQRLLLPPVPVRDAPDWICPRLEPAAFTRWDSAGNIRLTGGTDPAELQGAHLLLRRQEEPDWKQQAEIDVSGMAEGAMAGLTGYYGRDSFYLFAVRRFSTGCGIVLRQRIGEEDQELLLGMLSGFRATLRVEGSGLNRRISVNGTEIRHEFRAAYLADEGVRRGKRFTGATLGLFAQGDGEARFSGHQVIWERGQGGSDQSF